MGWFVMEGSLKLISVPICRSSNTVAIFIHNVYTYNVEIKIIAVINVVSVLNHLPIVFHVPEIE